MTPNRKDLIFQPLAERSGSRIPLPRFRAGTWRQVTLGAVESYRNSRGCLYGRSQASVAAVLVGRR